MSTSTENTFLIYFWKLLVVLLHYSLVINDLYNNWHNSGRVSNWTGGFRWWRSSWDNKMEISNMAVYFNSMDFSPLRMLGWCHYGNIFLLIYLSLFCAIYYCEYILCIIILRCWPWYLQYICQTCLFTLLSVAFLLIHFGHVTVWSYVSKFYLAE